MDPLEPISVDLRIELLGPPRVSTATGLVDIPRRQARALLYRLAAAAAPVARDQLTFLFWPDTIEAEARRNLTHVLTLLKRALPEESIIATPEHVGLNFRRVWVDTDQFDRLTATNNPVSRAAASQRAVMLWRGSFLMGFTLPSGEFEAWLSGEVARWEQRYLDVLATAVEAATISGAYDSAIDLARRYLTVDELAEEMHRRLMQLLAAVGDRTAALRQYARCADALRRELDVDPLPETQAVRDEVLSGRLSLESRAIQASIATASPQASLSVPHPPIHSDDLIGRAAEMAALVALLARPEVRLVTLTGEGGVGKTRLAQAAAATMHGFADGAVFVPLAPIRDPALVPAAIAKALGIQDTDNVPLVEQLSSFLAERNMVLVLDNFEHVLSAAPVIRDLLAASPRLKILATSRSLLQLSEEYAVAVAPLGLPDPETVPTPARLAESDAVALFVARAPALALGFSLTTANAADVAAICARLRGLPLALELAAARLRVMTSAQLLARLDRRPSSMTYEPGALPDRRQTLRTTLDWSVALLNIGEQLFFSRLAVFVGGWTLEAAEEVSLGVGPLTCEVVDGLQRLVDHHLVLRTAETGGEPRFSMLETIRAYTLEHLRERGEESSTRRAHARFFREFVVGAASNLHGPEQRVWFDRLDAELPNVRAAMEWLLASDEAAEGARLAAALHWYWHRRGRLDEGRDWLERALGAVTTPPGAAAGGLPPFVEAQARYGAALLALDQGDLTMAEAHLSECAQLCEVLERSPAAEGQVGRLNFRSQARLLQIAGMRGDEAPLQTMAKMDEWARSFHDPRIDAEHALNIGRGLLQLRGDLRAAQAHLHVAQALFRNLGDVWHLAEVRIDLGLIALLTNEVDSARDHFGAALAGARALGDRALEALAANNLGETARLAGNDDEANEHYQASLRLYRDLGCRSEIPRLIHNLGYLALHAGDSAGAREHFRESLSGFQAVGMPAGVSQAIAGLAAVSAAAGTPAMAERALRLWAASAAALEVQHIPIWPADRAEWQRYRTQAQALLGSVASATAGEDGEAVSLEEAIGQALAV